MTNIFKKNDIVYKIPSERIDGKRFDNRFGVIVDEAPLRMIGVCYKVQFVTDGVVELPESELIKMDFAPGETVQLKPNTLFGNKVVGIDYTVDTYDYKIDKYRLINRSRGPEIASLWATKDEIVHAYIGKRVKITKLKIHDITDLKLIGLQGVVKSYNMFCDSYVVLIDHLTFTIEFSKREFKLVEDTTPHSMFEKPKKPVYAMPPIDKFKVGDRVKVTFGRYIGSVGRVTSFYDMFANVKFIDTEDCFNIDNLESTNDDITKLHFKEDDSEGEESEKDSQIQELNDRITKLEDKYDRLINQLDATFWQVSKDLRHLNDVSDE